MFDDALHQKLLETFPGLQLCGGYQLCRCAPGSKRLEVIQPPPTGHTPLALANVIGQSRVYIRPLQRDISLADCSSQSQSDVSVHIPSSIKHSVLIYIYLLYLQLVMSPFHFVHTIRIGSKGNLHELFTVVPSE